MTKSSINNIEPLIIAFVISFIFLVGCEKQQAAYRPSTVIAQQASHNGIIGAVILKYGEKRIYRFGIRSSDGTILIVDHDFVPEAGYHDPIFKMTWSKMDDRVFVVVDHDFGDNNLKYVFNVKSYSWKTVEE